MCNCQVSIHVSMASLTYNIIECMFSIFEFIVHELIPDMFKYWRKRAYLLGRYHYLTWMWWLVMIHAHWWDPGPRPGKEINGTYWDVVHQTLYRLKDEFKQLTRERRRLDREYSCLVGFYDCIWNAAISISLYPFVYFFAMGYFVVRIFLYKAGLLVSNVREKRSWK